MAYLLARAADTISDSALIVPKDRLNYLLAFRRQVTGPASMGPLRDIEQALTGKQSLEAERNLLSSLPPAFALLESLDQGDQSLVRDVVTTLTKGMEADLTYFPAEDSGEIAALPDSAALDEYTYYAAGCVGEFWTSISKSHMRALKAWDQDEMAALGVRFGKALQLTNVLRDVPKDLINGRCYLPADHLERLGISPTELLEPINGAKAKPVLKEWTAAALDHFAAAEIYFSAIPRRCVRLRLSVLWPLLIGLKTLGRLARNEDWLDREQPSRVSRGWVYRMMAFSTVMAPSNLAIGFWLRRLRRAVENSS